MMMITLTSVPKIARIVSARMMKGGREVDPHVDEIVHPAAEAGGEKAQRRADEGAENRAGNREHKREPQRVEEPRHHVAAELVRAERMGGGLEGREQTGGKVHILESVGRDPGREKPRDEKHNEKRCARCRKEREPALFPKT